MNMKDIIMETYSQDQCVSVNPTFGFLSAFFSVELTSIHISGWRVVMCVTCCVMLCYKCFSMATSLKFCTGDHSSYTMTFIITRFQRQHVSGISCSLQISYLSKRHIKKVSMLGQARVWTCKITSIID